jgi:hypothetical protein
MFSEAVKYGVDQRGVVLIPSTDVSCLLPKEYDKDRVTTRYELTDPKGLTAPLEQGQKVGTLYIYYDGTVVGSTELETLTAVEEKSVEKAIADLTGKDKTDEEKSTFQKLLGYWYIPFLVIIGLFLMLVLRNAWYRRSRRKALERRRRRAMVRDAKAAEAQRQEAARNRQAAQSRQAARTRQAAMTEETRRIPNPELDWKNRYNRGGKP